MADEQQHEHIMSNEWDVYDRVCSRRFDTMEENIKRMLENGITSNVAEALENSRTARKIAWWAIGTMIVLTGTTLGALGWIAIIFIRYISGS